MLKDYFERFTKKGEKHVDVTSRLITNCTFTVAHKKAAGANESASVPVLILKKQFIIAICAHIFDFIKIVFYLMISNNI